MQDRQPGAPGQYRATLTAAEFQKMQSGEQFTITMIRDDQPIVEGTPYSKAAVLPDELAALICPDVLNPAPADALAALLPRRGTVPMAGDLHMDGHRVKGVAAPVEDGDAVNLKYANEKFAPAGNADNGHDTVIAQGTSGAWRYRKWASGIAECWISNHNFDNLSVSANSTQKTSLAFPFTFADTNYVETIAVTASAFPQNLIAYFTPKYAHYCEFCVHNLGSNPASGFALDLYFTGRWK